MIHFPSHIILRRILLYEYNKRCRCFAQHDNALQYNYYLLQIYCIRSNFNDKTGTEVERKMHIQSSHTINTNSCRQSIAALLVAGSCLVI